MKNFINPSIKIHKVFSQDLISCSDTGNGSGTIDDMPWGSRDRRSDSGWKEYEN